MTEFTRPSPSIPSRSQTATALREHASHRVRIARDLARLLSCAQFHDLTAADFFSACEVFDVLLDEGYKSLQALEVREGS
mgnify:CR=1 FL=1